MMPLFQRQTQLIAAVLFMAIKAAEGASLSEALCFPTIAAFDSGNLRPVAMALHEKYPQKPIVIAGDDDKHLEATQGVNPGKIKAEEAARAVGGKAIFPIFAPDEHTTENAKGFTDFNDLATKSSLGREGLERLVRAVLDTAVKHHAGVSIDQKPTRKLSPLQEREPHGLRR